MLFLGLKTLETRLFGGVQVQIRVYQNLGLYIRIFYSMVKVRILFFYPTYEPYTKDYVETFFRYSDERERFSPDNLTGAGTRTGDSGKEWGGYDPTSVGRHWQPASYLYDKYLELTEEDLAQYPFLERLDKLDEVGLIVRI